VAPKCRWTRSRKFSSVADLSFIAVPYLSQLPVRGHLRFPTNSDGPACRWSWNPLTAQCRADEPELLRRRRTLLGQEWSYLVRRSTARDCPVDFLLYFGHVGDVIQYIVDQVGGYHHNSVLIGDDDVLRIDNDSARN